MYVNACIQRSANSQLIIKWLGVLLTKAQFGEQF